MQLNVSYETQCNKTHLNFVKENLLKNLGEFKNTINDKQFGFFHLTDDYSQIEKVQNIYNKFKSKKYFVQVGIGGSALGPQMLVDSLQKDFSKKFLFLDNIDSDYLYEQLQRIENVSESLFYIVSKSGGTAETIAIFSILMNWLKSRGIEENEFSNYFVICTDPVKGDLRELANELHFESLEVPSNIGGRFSVLSSVGLLPAIFAGIDIEKLYIGANQVKPQLLNDSVFENPLLETASRMHYLMSEKGIDQTVIMPYSSKLKTLAFWFVQLWAESLGKIRDGETPTHVGFTPIPAYGATDQHSQVQLFMEGPKDKCILFIEVKNKKHDFSLNSTIDKAPFNKLKKHTLNNLMDAELNGTLQALKEGEREFIHFSISENNEQNLGALILFFESLTALMGHYLKIDPFNQPGVEKGKIYAYQYLNSLEV